MMSDNIKGQSDMKQSSEVSFGIAKRLALAFGGVGLLCVLVSLIGWNSLTELSETQQKIALQKVPAISSALELSNHTSQLVASAPLLLSASNIDELNNRYEQVKEAITKAEKQLEILTPLLGEEMGVSALEQKLKQIAPLMSQLKEISNGALLFAAKNEVLSQKLSSLRMAVEEKISPLSSSVNFKMMENTEGWVLLLEDSLTELRKGKDVVPDTMHLEDGPFNVLSYQKAVLEFQNSANLLIGLLLEGAQASSIADVEEMKQTFFVSIAKMATPLSQLEAENDVKELNDLFNLLLTLGNKGDWESNILELRRNQLQLVLQGGELLAQTRQISADLSLVVEQIVSSLKMSMDTAVAQNIQVSETARLTLIAVAIFSVIGVVLIGWLYVAGNLVKRLMQLVKAMSQIADGDLSTSINRNGKDELSSMGVALAVLRNRLREAEDVKSKQKKQQNLIENEKKANALKLADEFDMSVGNSLSVLSKNVSEIRKKSERMNKIAMQTLEETSEMSGASKVMSEDIAVVATSAQQLAASISEISQQVAKSTQVSKEAIDRANTLTGNMEKLQEESERIEGVVGLINKISEQINLLALNATIEASRAGEAGKGFAVVASEVKNLANQTGTAIDNISELIAVVQSEILSAVDATQDITSVIEDVDQVSTGIASAVEEQSAATSEISRAINNAATHVKQITNQVDDVSTSISATEQNVRDVLGGISEIDKQSDSLTQSVARFLEEARIP